MSRPLISFTHGLPGNEDYSYEIREMNDEEYAEYLQILEQAGESE